MDLDASVLTTYQTCRRKFILDSQWRSLRWRPKNLFDACLRRAIVQISSGMDPVEAGKDARAWFMQTAAEPGLDVLGNPFVIARDWCAMLDTILRALGKLTLLVIKDVPMIRLNSWLWWRPLCHQDDSGQLHRWITADSWTDDDLMRELHSWFVTGDIAMTKTPMMLHVINIGRMYKGRRASPWARAWQHPAISSLRLRFKKKDGSDLKGWKPVYLADRNNDDADSWVEQLYSENVIGGLLHHVLVNVPSEAVCADTQYQIMHEALAMRVLLEESPSYRSLPMSRGMCDGMVPCHFQPVCFNDKLVEIDTLNLYKERESGYAAVR